VKAIWATACALALVGLFAPAGQATRECDGLDVCISVGGPWVAIPPAARGVRAPAVEYQLDCPPRSVVGGLDAQASERAIDVVFIGALGSPVNPGITTGRSAVFQATYTGGRRRPTGFRPLNGCIPTSGGGGRGTTSVGAVPPGSPPVRRIRTVRVRSDRAARATLSCAPRERLLSSSHAVAFRTRTQPPANVLGGVRVARSLRGETVVVTARRSEAVPRRLRVDVQIHAICARRIA
jgi:hypothetical protein